MRYRPLVTAHSGCENTPENSLESLLAGIAACADTVEMDVRFTRDGTPILMHDPTVERDGVQVPVEELRLDDIPGAARQEDGGSRPPAVTTLDSALELLGSYAVMANLDLKDNLCIEAVVSLVRRHDLAAMIVITGCTPARADLVRTAAPELPVLLNVDRPPAPANEDTYLQWVRLACRTATEHHCCGINVPFEQCRPELVEHARRRYLPVSVWTVDSAGDMKRFAEMGVHSITTYRPRALAELLGRTTAGVR